MRSWRPKRRSGFPLSLPAAKAARSAGPHAAEEEFTWEQQSVARTTTGVFSPAASAATAKSSKTSRISAASGGGADGACYQRWTGCARCVMLGIIESHLSPPLWLDPVVTSLVFGSSCSALWSATAPSSLPPSLPLLLASLFGRSPTTGRASLRVARRAPPCEHRAVAATG
ncbi:hypothetical protein BHM03_00040834 [Ensete ventricosum]|nr:hypothetical protein BHM03_00040834 [Ensete ventricosum]